MEAIYKLMQKHSAQFGDTTMDDMKSQMQLYGFSWNKQAQPSNWHLLNMLAFHIFSAVACSSCTKQSL
jgi:hypothetical protein